ncbi:hypothetical protein KC19_3G051900 [Ceratodon purpureus]|uniref:Uncharacterized protein n=1 Tax=Ceratodon purpureus TaxID=3225 RepID=A0A8T0IIN0_CERPU|nr:hypothetical protein KC19_3G051900 [Ceratodon purpureus]
MASVFEAAKCRRQFVVAASPLGKCSPAPRICGTCGDKWQIRFFLVSKFKVSFLTSHSILPFRSESRHRIREISQISKTRNFQHHSDISKHFHHGRNIGLHIHAHGAQRTIRPTPNLQTTSHNLTHLRPPLPQPPHHHPLAHALPPPPSNSPARPRIQQRQRPRARLREGSGVRQGGRRRHHQASQRQERRGVRRRSGGQLRRGLLQQRRPSQRRRRRLRHGSRPR